VAIFLGIDSGSTSTKLVLLDAGGQVRSRRLAPTGLHCDHTAVRLWQEMCHELGLAPHEALGAVATGYGRRQISLAKRVVTEITCQARGVHHLAPHARTVIDVGGQDSKVIHLDAAGGVQDFVMNDKCAAGTGRFLEVLAARFGVTVDQLGTFSGESAAEAVEINSTCTVFAETEVIGLLGEGRDRAAIVAGVHLALARRVAAMADQLGAESPIAFSGGVALNPAMAAMLQTCLNQPVLIPPEPQFTAALGAALLARG
jgi:predicted CoA-substrate-specific enzyme activase